MFALVTWKFGYLFDERAVFSKCTSTSLRTLPRSFSYPTLSQRRREILLWRCCNESWHTILRIGLGSRLGVDEIVLVSKEISSGSKMAKKKQPLHELHAEERGCVRSIWCGLESNLPARLGFLGPLPKRQSAKSGGVGDGSVTVSHVRDSVRCAGMEDGEGTAGDPGLRRRRRGTAAERDTILVGGEGGGPVAHGLVSTCTPVSPVPCGGWIGVFTYIESLPTYNYRLPILPFELVVACLLACLLDEPQCQIHEVRVMPPRSA